MTNRSIRRLLAFCLLVSLAAAVAYAGSDMAQDASWQPVRAEAVRARLDEYLRSSTISPAAQAEVRNRWREMAEQTDADVLERLAQSLAKADEHVAELVSFCSAAGEQGRKLPTFPWLANSETPNLVSQNMRLYLARWLVQQGYYDEAIAWTDGLRTEEVVAPEALLFYRAVAHHQLVEAEKADSAIDRLLEGQEKLPNRYQKLADLMRHDMEGLKDDSLDHIARRMEDSRRRLAQGRPGERAQDVQKGVIESLDKLIKKAEDQAQQQSKMAASSSRSAPGTPMQDSQIGSALPPAPGKVDPSNIGRGTGWGNLNDKDREKAMQEIGREFPSHYREVIEQYFRRLAAEESADHP